MTAWADGWFNDDWFPSYRETYERYVELGSVAGLSVIRDEMCTRRAFIEAYQDANAYHPFHAFSMLSMAELAHRLLERIIIVGAREPRLMDAMGYVTVNTFDEAIAAAESIVKRSPRILVLPSIRQHTPVHLFAGGSA